MSDKNPYDILGVSKNATPDTIKKAYRLLAKKYHPDKCKDTDAEEKFTNIQTAYELLINPDSKLKYDSLDLLDRLQFYDEFKNVLLRKYPTLTNLFKNIVGLFYDDENEFRTDFNKLNFTGIYSKVLDKVPIIFSTIEPPVKIGNNNTNIIDLNIYHKIHSTMTDKYTNKVVKMNINRTTKDQITINIPLREDKYILTGYGETDGTNHGDIIVTISTEFDNNFIRSGNNLYYLCEISLFEYLYGGETSIVHLDREKVNIKYEGFINKVSMQIIDNKGLPYVDETNDIKRGNLHIFFTIKNINNNTLKEKIFALE